MVLSILGVLLCVVAGIGKAVQDTLAHHYGNSIFSDKSKYPPIYWNAKISWMNKYQFNPETGRLDASKEKFFGSTTMFVALTDGWHTFQLIHINSLIGGVFLIGYANVLPFSSLFTGVLLYRVVFEIMYRWGLKK